jgi:hypothetical protein
MIAVSADTNSFALLRSDIITLAFEMNLVENNPLGRVVSLSIWQSYCIIKSAAAAYASMNPLTQWLINRDEYHPYPTKGTRD